MGMRIVVRIGGTVSPFLRGRPTLQDVSWYAERAGRAGNLCRAESMIEPVVAQRELVRDFYALLLEELRTERFDHRLFEGITWEVVDEGVTYQGSRTRLPLVWKTRPKGWWVR